MTGNTSSMKLDNATLVLFQNVNTSIAISVIYVLVTSINVVGNGLSMWLLLFRTSPKTPSIIFMINLTLTDLALGTALPFQISYQLQGYNWILGSKMCRYKVSSSASYHQDGFHPETKSTCLLSITAS